MKRSPSPTWFALFSALIPALAGPLGEMGGGIDTHIHLYEPEGLDWLKPAQTNLFRPHHATDFKAISKGTPLARAVVVEAGTAVGHTEWMLRHTRDEPAIAAVIGNLDLAAGDTAGLLKRFSQEPKFRGIRLRGRGPVDFSLPEVQANLALMESLHLVLETGLDAHTREHLLGIAKRHPSLTIVINHMADGRLDQENRPQSWWRPAIESLGACPNVYCKLSMFDVVFKKDYAPERLAALFEPLLASFGPDRLLYGSNWPVSPDYGQMFGILEERVGGAPGELLRKILIDNPVRAYRIEPAIPLATGHNLRQ